MACRRFMSSTARWTGRGHVEQVLVPTLRPATSSVIAKPAHPMRLWAFARGAELRFTQPHSPLHNTSGRLTYIEFLLPVPRVWPVGWAKAGVAQCQTNALRRNWGPA